MRHIESSDRYQLAEAIKAAQAAKRSELRLAALRRSEELAAILARLDEARREHAESYLASRAHRETSTDLS